MRLMRVVWRRYRKEAAWLVFAALAFGGCLFFVVNYTGWTVGSYTLGTPPSRAQMADDFIRLHYYELSPADRQDIRNRYGGSDNDDEISPARIWKAWGVSQ